MSELTRREQNAVLSVIREALRNPQRFTSPNPGELRELEWQTRAVPAALTQLGWKITRSGSLLTDSQRFQVEHARDCLGTWDLERAELGPDAPYVNTETVLADQVRALLGVLDGIAPKREG